MVELSISDVRRALWLELPERVRNGQTANSLVGQLFHEAAAELLNEDKLNQWQTAVDEETVSNSAALSEHIYERILGPQLAARRVALQEAGAQLLILWQAVGELSRWLSALLSDAQRSGRIRFDKETRQWQGDLPLCLPEYVLSWTVSEPGWEAPVRVSGIADSLWKNPATGRWCVVEYKLGRGIQEIDLAQACLYHEMLVAAGLTSSDGALALVAFKPEREETLFQSAELAAVKSELRRLIGRLAKVDGTKDESSALGEKLVETYAEYGVRVILVGEPTIGPSFIRYEVMPAERVKINDIRRYTHELQVRMGLEVPPMIHTDRGRLVIDVKRKKPEPVLFREFYGKPLGLSEVPIGVDLEGRLHAVNIALNDCPHMLVSGTAGSGKSEWMRTALAGLLLANQPATLQLVLIDPKRSAFNGMEGSAYLYKGWEVLHPNDRPVPEVLDELIAEMDRRNLLFKEAGADDLAAYVTKTGKPLARIVLFCDEYFDLIATRKMRTEIEIRIARLGSKGRSSGIHLIIATQYPKADVVTGVIKANLSGRVCLRMTDSRQSLVVLGQTGAEQLLGKGDLLFQDIGEPKRLQALWLPEAERLRIFKKWTEAVFI